MAISLDTRIRAKNDLVSCEIGGEVYLLDFGKGIYYGLNAVAGRTLQLAQEPRTLREIRDILVGEFDVEPEECTRDLLRLAEQLYHRKLVDWQNGKALS